jgi:hypothetical protein
LWGFSQATLSKNSEFFCASPPTIGKPPITRIDANILLKVHLRYLRHLRAKLGGRADRVSSIEHRVSRWWAGIQP